jgi:hypothetical protein
VSRAAAVAALKSRGEESELVSAEESRVPYVPPVDDVLGEAPTDWPQVDTYGF